MFEEGCSAKCEAQVVTISRVSDYDSSTIEQLATRWFNAWQIDDAATNDGILIMVAVEDRLVRIEVGDGYGGRLDEPLKRVIDDNMTPRFRDGQFRAGIQAGIASIRRLNNTPATPVASDSQWTVRTPSAESIVPTPIVTVAPGQQA